MVKRVKIYKSELFPLYSVTDMDGYDDAVEVEVDTTTALWWDHIMSSFHGVQDQMRKALEKQEQTHG